MGQPAAKKGDSIVCADIHTVVDPQGVAVQLPNPFNGSISDGCVDSVKIGGKPAAVKGSKAKNSPKHLPPPTMQFQRQPNDEGEITAGSSTVNIGGQPAARLGDQAKTCSELPVPAAVVVAGPPTVMIGG
jgi:uncharacterized Zn-binding protein involved in type VI secretion